MCEVTYCVLANFLLYQFTKTVSIVILGKGIQENAIL